MKVKPRKLPSAAARRALDTAERALRAGQALQQEGRPLEAGALYRQVLAAVPDHAAALYLLGVIELQSASPETAVELFRHAARVRPDFADAHANLGYALSALRRFDDAVDALRRALSVDPRHKLAANNLGNALLALGSVDEALVAFRQALRIDSGYAHAHYNLGIALRDAGLPSMAAASLREALALDPQFTEAHYELGLANWESGELLQSAECFRQALRLRPKYPQAWFQLHCVALDLEGRGAAIECLQQAVKLDPQDACFRFFLGMLLSDAGDVTGASPHLAAASAGSAADRARLAGWQYLQALPTRPRLVGSPIRTFQLAFDAAPKRGLVLEFGVRMGASIRQIAALANQAVHGFDSFRGIPEDWHGEPRGSYSTGGVLPAVPANVSLHAGWFDEALPEFLDGHPGPVRLINVDCDLYSSTETVLRLLKNRIAPGSVIVFDEYLGYEHWREDEFKAFQEAAEQHAWRYRYLCVSFATKQAAVQIL